jgi:hypothetical protein
MLELDNMFMLINDYLYVCILLSCLFAPITTTMFERERDQVKLGSSSTFSHKTNLLHLFTCYLISVLIKLKNTKISLLINFSFVKLANCECLTTTPVSWGHKPVVCCCRLLEKYKKKNHHFPQKFDINPRVTLVGKTPFLHHSILGVPTSGKFKE